MKRILVSIILPVYNVEKYLNQCIESVVNQSYRNIEIILVDDGSTDSCPQICDKWALKDSRIRVVHKLNEGLGMARNTGLNIASGSYVAFVDSDDFIEEDTIERLVLNLKTSDTVLCGHYIYQDKNNIVKVPLCKKNKTFSGKDIQEKVLLGMMGALPKDPKDTILSVSVWHGIYSLDIIQKCHIRFPSEREFISEDMIFDIDYFTNANKVTFIEDCLYYYRKNNDSSLTTIYNPERFNKEIILYYELCRKLNQIMSEEKYILRLQRTFLGRVRSCIVRAEKQNDIGMIYKICNDPNVCQVLKEYPYYKNKLSLYIFNECIKQKWVPIIRFLIKIRY